MIERGKKQEVGQRESNAQHPDSKRYTQRRTSTHSRAQWVHNGHVPEIRTAQFECHKLFVRWNFVSQTLLNYDVLKTFALRMLSTFRNIIVMFEEHFTQYNEKNVMYLVHMSKMTSRV